jgi:hypothetical protein
MGCVSDHHPPHECLQGVWRVRRLTGCLLVRFDAGRQFAVMLQQSFGRRLEYPMPDAISTAALLYVDQDLGHGLKGLGVVLEIEFNPHGIGAGSSEGSRTEKRLAVVAGVR